MILNWHFKLHWVYKLQRICILSTFLFKLPNVISKHKFRKEFNVRVRVILGIFQEDTLLEQVELNEEHTFRIPLQEFNLNLISPTPTPFNK